MTWLTEVGKPYELLYHSRKNLQRLFFPSDGWRFQKSGAFAQGWKVSQDRKSHSNFSESRHHSPKHRLDEGMTDLRPADLGYSVEIIEPGSENQRTSSRQTNPKSFHRLHWSRLISLCRSDDFKTFEESFDTYCPVSEIEFTKMRKSVWEHHQWDQLKVILVVFRSPLKKD